MALHIFIITFFKNNFSSRKINLKFLFIVRMLIVLTVFAQRLIKFTFYSKSLGYIFHERNGNLDVSHIGF